MTNDIDFLLFAPLKEEREAVLAQLPSPQRLPPDEQDIRVYYQAEVPTELPGGARGHYRVVVTSPLNMGQVEAAAATADAIRRFKPRYVLLVGIAGGDPDAVALGDVLIAEQFVVYEMQKITGAGVQVRYQSYRADPRLYGATQHLSGWETAIKTARPKAKGSVSCHYGIVISGDKVQAAHGALKPYKADWPKLIGVEMEAGGVAAAAWEAPSKPGVLMIRGVSDLADEKKGSSRVKSWRPYACDVAAAYAVSLLRSGPVPLAAAATAPAGMGSLVQASGTGPTTGVGSVGGSNPAVAVNVNTGGAASSSPPSPSPSPSPSALASAGAAGARPTRASLRKLLEEMLRTDSDFNAFCLDYFEDTHGQFSNGMDRDHKRSLLLQREDAIEILNSLKTHNDKAYAKHAHHLRFES